MLFYFGPISGEVRDEGPARKSVEKTDSFLGRRPWDRPRSIGAFLQSAERGLFPSGVGPGAAGSMQGLQG